MRRLHVKPGLTGAVAGEPDGRTCPWHETVSLDLRYVDNWSPAMDMNVMARTVARGAERPGRLLGIRHPGKPAANTPRIAGDSPPRGMKDRGCARLGPRKGHCHGADRDHPAAR
ncbi:sugar transferase [Streptomyces tricolor]|nr:sugar transferase [Streptomyces tricolor]